MKSKRSPLSIIVLVGLIILTIGVFTVKNAMAARKWPTTEGRITSSSVSENRKYDSSSKSYKTEFRADISYSYNVNNVEYIGDKLFYGAVKLSKSTAKKYCDRYPYGAVVDVHYNPENPKQSVLETGIGVRSYMALIIGLVITAFGIYLFVSPDAGSKST